MAYKKVAPQEPKLKKVSVREAVAELGDYWRYATIFGPQAIQLSFRVGGSYSDWLLMKCCEIGKIDRVSDSDIREGSALLIEDRILDEEKAAARAYDDIDADEPDQEGRTALDDMMDDPRSGLAELVNRERT